ncbi:MAG TPA: Sec-independent protein translocase protein TatB [Alphaproteobacteria bacterium]|jgi:sec-independent protein translocase protein TatB|nr:Sec-independent protein translocase protein TatB [Alphaproteobacteria bacterium]
MFDIGWSELAVIALVALLVIGPKDLPKAMRTAALWIRKIRSLANEFQSGLNEIVREAELDELKRDIDRATSADVKSHIANTIDPSGQVERELDLAGELRNLDKPAETASAESAPAAPAGETPAAEERPKETAAADDDGSGERAAKP